MVLFINDVTKNLTPVHASFSTERSQKPLTIHYKGMTSLMGDPWLETKIKIFFGDITIKVIFFKFTWILANEENRENDWIVFNEFCFDWTSDWFPTLCVVRFSGTLLSGLSFQASWKVARKPKERMPTGARTAPVLLQSGFIFRSVEQHCCCCW